MSSKSELESKCREYLFEHGWSLRYMDADDVKHGENHRAGKEREVSIGSSWTQIAEKVAAKSVDHYDQEAIRIKKEHDKEMSLIFDKARGSRAILSLINSAQDDINKVTEDA